MKRVLIIILLISPAFGQRYDNFASTVASASGIGNLMQAIPNATITVCNFPGTGGTPCTNKATTYTNQTLLTACSLGTQVVLQGSSTCQATGDTLGNFGFWAPPGKYQYCVSATNFTTQCYNAVVPVDATAATTFNAALYVGGSVTTWSGSDIGAQINSAYASLPANGGAIYLLPQTGGGCYNFSTPITFTTIGKYVTVFGFAPNSNTTSNVNGGACLNYTPTTATSAISIDVTPVAGGGYTPGTGLRDIQLTNNTCITAGGCASSAVGVNLGGTNGGCHRCMFLNVKVSGFGTGFKINDIVGWGIQWMNTSLSYNTTGLSYNTSAHENDTMVAPAITVNGTGVSMGSGSNVELSIYGGSSDGNTGTYFSNGGGQLYISDHHLENPTCVSDAYFTNAGNTKISGGELLEDCTTASVAQLITQTAGQLDLRGVAVFSGGRTITNLVNISGGAATVDWFTSSPTIIPASGNSIDTCSTPARCRFTRMTGTANQLASYAPFFAIPASTLAGAPPGIAATTIMWTDPGSDGMWKYNPGNNGEQHVPQMFVLTSAYTNATTGFTTVTPFSFPATASKNYTFSCHLFYQAAATGGLNIQFTGPASPTFVTYGLNEALSASTFADATATAYGASIGTAVTTATTNFDAFVTFGLVNGANAGTVTLQAKSSAAVNLTIQPGSFCQWQ